MACEPLRMPLPFDPGFHKSERSGTPVFTVCTMTLNDLDLTESPHWNIALKRRYIIHPSDSNPSPYSEMDPQWCKLFAYQSLDQEGRWLDANEAMAKLLGYPNPESMIGEEFSKHMASAPQEIFRETSMIEREIPLLRLDGSTFDAIISTRLQRNGEDGIVRAHSIVLDVTERVETLRASEASKEVLERMVSQRTAELEESLTMRNQFLAHMSHEIRNPMNIIGVNSHLLERTPLNDNQKGMVARIRRASSVMLSLLNEVLDYSKLEAGEITLETAPFSLCELLKSLDLLQGGAAEEKNLELVSSSDANTPDEWIGDRRRIEQVLINLSSNAIKFTDAGRIEINASVLHRPRQCCALRFEVTDTGCGIPADEISSLFQPFKQTRQNSQAKIKGTGLGLSISKGLVELMGGSIGVQSTPGIGSSFWFSIPLPCAANHPDIDSFNEGHDKFEGCRFLIVDDDEESRDSLKSLLESEGAQCRVASNGQEGIEQLASRPRRFDAVLMDIQMPVMDGIKATRQIRQQLKLNHLPIIAMTGGLTLEQQHQAMESGITHLLKKPIEPEDLASVLSRYCFKTQEPVRALKMGEDPVS